MITIITTLSVCLVLGVFYLIFKQEQIMVTRREQMKRTKIKNYYETEMKKIEKLELAGIAEDGNSDYPVAKAISKINLPKNVRIYIND